MNSRLLLAALCSSLFSLSIAAIAQDKLPTPPGKGGAAASPSAPATPDLNAVQTQPKGAETPAPAAQDDAAVDAAATTLEERVEQLEQEVLELKSNLLSLQNELAEKDAELLEIVQAISERDSNNQPILALRSIMKSSDQFRQEMQKAVNESIQREGQLVVDNRTSGVQFLSVNGKTERIEALTRHVFKVPVGTLTTELIGQESAKNWTVGAPGYRQEIIIRPRTRQVVASPVIIVE
jgi:hypothetical protein